MTTATTSLWTAPVLQTVIATPAAASAAPVQLLRAVAEGELAAFDELLPALGLTHRIVGQPDGRDRLDVALGTVQVGILFFGPDGKLESVKLWEKIPTVQLEVVAAELLQHNGIRVVLDSSSEDLAAEVRHRLSALATSFEDLAV